MTPRALADADEATAYIRQFAPEAAARWFDGLVEAVLSLEVMPRRCPTAPEAETLGAEVRQLLYGQRAGRYRILFRVYDDEDPPIVRVVAIRHGARGQLTVQDFNEIA